MLVLTNKWKNHNFFVHCSIPPKTKIINSQLLTALPNDSRKPSDSQPAKKWYLLPAKKRVVLPSRRFPRGECASHVRTIRRRVRDSAAKGQRGRGGGRINPVSVRRSVRSLVRRFVWGSVAGGLRRSVGTSPARYLRLTDSLPRRVERAVATNHAEKAGLSLLWETPGIFLCRG